jgi:hypothetical protein
MSQSEEIAAAAARLVVDEGMEYAGAKRRAARDLLRHGGRRSVLPTSEEVEDAVREHISLFCADSQPGELRAMREVARIWMQRLAPFRPHLSGAVWRGTATRLSCVHLDLYCDDTKAAEIALINAGVDFDSNSLDGRHGQEDTVVLSLATPCAELGEPVTLHLSVHDLDQQRGALKPDARGRSWRGDLAALERLLAAPQAPQ